MSRKIFIFAFVSLATLGCCDRGDLCFQVKCLDQGAMAEVKDLKIVQSGCENIYDVPAEVRQFGVKVGEASWSLSRGSTVGQLVVKQEQGPSLEWELSTDGKGCYKLVIAKDRRAIEVERIQNEVRCQLLGMGPCVVTIQSSSSPSTPTTSSSDSGQQGQ